MKKRFLSILTAFMLTAAFVPQLGAHAADDRIHKNMEDGSFYEGWNRNGTGTFSVQEQPDGSLNTAWDAVKESLIRYGTGAGKNRTVSMRDKIQVSYEAEIGGEGIYYFGVGGYLNNPSCEFYVIEGWNVWQPPGNKDVLKTVEIDGVQYDLYQTTGESWADLDHFTYPVFWSVRHENLFREGQTNACAGTVSLDAHFRAWYSLDPTEIMGGTLPEVCVETDAFGLETLPASGTCKIAKPVFTFGLSDDAESTGTAKEENIIYQQGFETNRDLWKRATFGAGTKLYQDRKNAAEGLCSMRASTEGGQHCGAELSLVPYSMKTDKTYYVQAAVLQNSFDTADFRVECDFDARNGSGVRWSGGVCSDINLVKKGEWTVIRFAFCPDKDLPSDDEEKKCGDADIRLSFYMYDYARMDEDGCYPLEKRPSEFWIDSVTVSESGYPPLPDLSGAFREGPENIIYQQGFETNRDLWKRATFGTGTWLYQDRKNAAEGLCSMRAENAGGHHCGAELSLAQYSMKTDKTYYVQAAVLQNSFDTADFRVECDFDARIGSGVCWSGGVYSGINPVKKGEWTVIRFAFCPDKDLPSDDEEKKCGDADIRLSFYMYDYARMDEYGCYTIEERPSEFWIDSVTVSESGYPPLPDLSGAFREETACTGDANCDGTVDVADAVLIMRYAVEDREAVITDQGKLNSDTDGDGNVSAEDAKLILLFVAKKIENL